MVALTAPVRSRLRGKEQHTHAIKDGETIFLGGYVALELATGRVVPYTDAVGLLELGRAVEFDSPLQTGGSALGDTAGTVKVIVDLEGGIIEGVPVGIASAETDVGDAVFMATDNIETDLTTAATVNGRRLGRIVRFLTSTSFDVLLFSHESITAGV